MYSIGRYVYTIYVYKQCMTRNTYKRKFFIFPIETIEHFEKCYSSMADFLSISYQCQCFSLVSGQKFAYRKRKK